MKLIEPSFEILKPIPPINGMEMLKLIEKAGRTCYKSESNITNESALEFVTKIIKWGHESVLEHESITIKFISNRGFSHEMVRHRIASYSQESTRYVNYSKHKEHKGEIKCINLTNSLDEFDKKINVSNYGKEKAFDTYSAMSIFIRAWSDAEDHYNTLINMGASPQFARNVLPIGIKTEIVVTANLREWREIFRQRTANVAHPQMKELMRPLLEELRDKIPVIFDDIAY